MKKNKFSIRLLLIILVLLLCIQIPTFAANKGKSTATNVRVRKSASTQSEVIDVLATGEEVEILTEEGNWYKVKAKGHTGYVSKSFINIDGNVQENNVQVQENNNQSQESNTQNSNSQVTENNVVENNNQSSGNNAEVNNEEQQSNPENTTNVENNNEQTVVNQAQGNVNIVKNYKASENAKIYILPVLASEQIGEVKKDENVTVLENAGLWVFIQTSNLGGWVRIDKLTAEDVKIDDSTNAQDNENSNTEIIDENKNEQNENTENKENAEKSEVNNNQQTNYKPKTMYVKSSTVNVRSKSNISSNIVTGITLNTQVKVVGEENGWYKVEVNGKNGYIRKDLLSNTKTEVTSRDNNIDRAQKVEQNVTVSTINTAEQQTQVTGATQPTETQQVQNTQTGATQSAQPQTSAQQQASAQTQQQAQAPAQKPSNSVPTSSTGVTGNDIVAYAMKFKGYRYVYGAAGPNAFDCSGFTMYVYKHFGYSLSHSSRVQATQGKKVTGELQPGDILVFTNGGTQVGHVGIYIGNDKFIHASDSKTGVIISNLSDRWNKSKYVGARRIL